MSSLQFEDFVHKYPAYGSSQQLDDLRASEHKILDDQGHVYLDYTGAGLYSTSQLNAHQELLKNEVFGNPHSCNPTSIRSTELVEQARFYVLEFFNASPEEYVCIFTQNASGALKIVGEAYPFGAGCRYLLTFDNHNSVNGIREYAHARGASVTYLPLILPDLRVDENGLMDSLKHLDQGCFNLFAYPAQSNFSGVHHSLDWIASAQDQGWDVLLDAAAFVPTNRLDLGKFHPDFVPLSFYKMFGYPTGIGALITRKQTLRKLSRSWFAGGTTTVASVRGNRFYSADAPAAFEDGTVNYLNIPAVEIGLRHLNRFGYDTIHERVTALTGWLLEKLAALKHTNEKPLVKIYGPLDTHDRGGTIALNFFDAQGEVIPKYLLEEKASCRKISIRMGFFCNPGAGEIALDISGDELSSCFSRPDYESRISDLDFQRCIDPKASGAVRVSIGLVSDFSDIQAFLAFAETFLE